MRRLIALVLCAAVLIATVSSAVGQSPVIRAAGTSGLTGSTPATHAEQGTASSLPRSPWHKECRGVPMPLH
jgi:hypothetical protein